MKLAIYLLMGAGLSLQIILIAIVSVLSSLSFGRPIAIETPIILAFLTVQTVIVILVAAYIESLYKRAQGKK